VKQDNEKALLIGLARNETKSVEAIYRDNYNTIHSLIINNNGSSDEKVRSGSFELNCQIKTYLYSVCRRLWLKRLQQLNRYGAPVENLDNLVPVEEEIEAHDQRNAEFEMMNKAISGLGEPCKSLLEAYYLQKRNMQDIAISFGYTNADNAKNQKYKCLVRLKKIFFSHYKNGNGDE